MWHSWWVQDIVTKWHNKEEGEGGNQPKCHVALFGYYKDVFEQKDT